MRRGRIEGAPRGFLSLGHPPRSLSQPAPARLEPRATSLTPSTHRTQAAQLAAEEAERRISGVEQEKEALEKQYEVR